MSSKLRVAVLGAGGRIGSEAARAVDAADDARCDAWAKASMQRLDPISLGSQMNDENMLAHPQHYLSPEASKRLEALRAKYDPKGVFLSYLTVATAV